MPENEPEQEFLFEIDGPDEEGNVWIVSPEGRNVWCHNLGQQDMVAEVMSDGLNKSATGKTIR